MRGVDLCPRFSAPLECHTHPIKVFSFLFFMPRNAHIFFPLQSTDYFTQNLLTVVLTSLLFMSQILIYFYCYVWSTAASIPLSRALLLYAFLGTTPRLTILHILTDLCKYWPFVSLFQQWQTSNYAEPDRTTGSPKIPSCLAHISPGCGRTPNPCLPDFFYVSPFFFETASNDHTLPPLFP